MQLSHTPVVVFDESNLVSAAGLVPLVRLAQDAGVARLAEGWLSVPTDKGAHAGLKVSSLVAGMAAGADSIDDMGVLRHGGMGRVFCRLYAPSTLGSFLRGFTFGHVRQLDAVASRFTAGLAARTALVAGIDQYALVDVDDTIIETYGDAKQGAGFGYSGVRGLNALLATVSTRQAAPVIVAQRLRRGAVNSARGAGRLVADALGTVARLRSAAAAGPVLLRADSAFYNRAAIGAAVAAGAQVSVTVRLDRRVTKAITSIGEGTWQRFDYPAAFYDADACTWVQAAEVAEVPFTAFASKRAGQQVGGRLIVRRIREPNPKAGHGQPDLIDLWRYHAFFTTSALDTVTAARTHHQHAVIEQVHADVKNAALAHLPSAKFAANSAWLVLAVMAFNLTRAAATLAQGNLAKATTATIRAKLITVPARLASSARKLTMHLPTGWPWQHPWTRLFTAICEPPPTAAAT